MKLFRKKTDNRIKRPVKKTKANAGESLIEMLVSLLIISVSIALLISTVGSSGFLIKKSQEKFDSYYEGSNNLATQTTQGASGSMTFEYASLESGDDSNRSNANIYELSKTTKADVVVNYFINDESKKTTVASYKAIITNNDGGSGGSGETPVDGE